LGIEFPIFAFSHCRDVVAAVSKAGGYGVLGALAFDPEQLDMELTWIDKHAGGKPYGVDIVMPAKYIGQGGGEEAKFDNLADLIPQQHRDFVEGLMAERGVPPLPEGRDDSPIIAAGLTVDSMAGGHVEVSRAHGATMLVNALGPPPPEVIEQAHDNDVLVGALIGSRQHAERQVAQGVDVIVAQGTEAGGHTGEVATMVLVPEVVDAVGPDVPVLAAGGIGSGRQMAASLALGAQGVWTGSIWAGRCRVVLERLQFVPRKERSKARIRQLGLEAAAVLDQTVKMARSASQQIKDLFE
jgi:NAD(P)H-dependent flavin oxidoreductase YrpB (nitropropane dioxygenase family)